MNALTTEIVLESRETRDVTDQVQKRLQRADELETACQELIEKLQRSETQNGQLMSENSSLKSLERTQAQLDARSNALDERERAMDAEKALGAVRLAAEQTRVADHQNMFNLVFRNQEIRKTTFQAVSTHSPSVAHCDHEGNVTCVTDGGSFAEVIPVDTKAEAV